MNIQKAIDRNIAVNNTGSINPDLGSILRNIVVNCEVWDPFGKSIKKLTYSKEEVTQRLDAIKKNI